MAAYIPDVANSVYTEKDSMTITIDAEYEYDLSCSYICSRCTHLRDGHLKTCDAFPEGKIPREIWEAKNDHTTPYPGDHGILFNLNPNIRVR